MKFKVNYFNGWYDQVKELDEIVSNQLGLSHEFIEKHKSTRKGEIVTRMQVVSHIARAAYKVKGVQLSAYFERDHACINNNGRRVEGWIDVKDQAFINLLPINAPTAMPVNEYDRATKHQIRYFHAALAKRGIMEMKPLLVSQASDGRTEHCTELIARPQTI